MLGGGLFAVKKGAAWTCAAGEQILLILHIEGLR
jgi:hypothetical protein